MWVRWSLMLMAVAMPAAQALSTSAEVHASVEFEVDAQVVAEAGAQLQGAAGGAAGDAHRGPPEEEGWLPRLRQGCAAWAAALRAEGEAGAGFGLAAGVAAMVALGRRLLL